jgi:hypothetical protein
MLSGMDEKNVVKQFPPFAGQFEHYRSTADWNNPKLEAYFVFAVCNGTAAIMPMILPKDFPRQRYRDEASLEEVTKAMNAIRMDIADNFSDVGICIVTTNSWLVGAFGDSTFALVLICFSSY